jgi:hypothetical protein
MEWLKFKVKTHYGKAKNVVTSYYFLGILKLLHNMLNYNTKNSIAKNFFFSNLYCEVLKYIYGKKNMSPCT